MFSLFLIFVALAAAQSSEEHSFTASDSMRPKWCQGSVAAQFLKAKAGTFKSSGGVTKVFLNPTIEDVLKERALRAAMGRKSDCCLNEDLVAGQGFISGDIICNHKQKFMEETGPGADIIVHRGKATMCPGDHMVGWEKFGIWKFSKGVFTASIPTSTPSSMEGRLNRAITRKENSGCCLSDDLSADVSSHGWIVCDPEFTDDSEVQVEGTGKWCPGPLIADMWKGRPATFRMDGEKIVLKFAEGYVPESVRKRVIRTAANKEGEDTDCCLEENLRDGMSGRVICNERQAVRPRATNERCSFYATVADKDPKGLNVRSAPTSRVNNVVSQVYYDNMVSVSDCNDKGWCKITSNENFGEPRPRGAKPFKAGWVYGKYLNTDTNESARNFYKAYSKTSPVVQTRMGGGLQVLQCEGNWVKVRDPKNGKIGWLAPGDHCGNPVTTCA